jgi:hypothetical protein
LRDLDQKWQRELISSELRVVWEEEKEKKSGNILALKEGKN